MESNNINDDPYHNIPEEVKPFYDSFNRNHPDYHNGISKPVPYSDNKKVPETMPNEYPENYNPDEAKPDLSESDPICIKIKESISLYNTAKKSLNTFSDLLIKKKILIENNKDKKYKIKDTKIEEKYSEVVDLISSSKDKEYFDIIESDFNTFKEIYNNEPKGTVAMIDELSKFIQIYNRNLFKVYNDNLKLLKDRKNEINN